MAAKKRKQDAEDEKNRKEEEMRSA